MLIKKLPLLLLTLFTLGFAISMDAQQDKSERPSPPAKATAELGDLSLVIDYSQPAVNGRDVWGGLVPFDKVWRTGANEATTFEINQDVLIQGEKLAFLRVFSLFSC